MKWTKKEINDLCVAIQQTKNKSEAAKLVHKNSNRSLRAILNKVYRLSDNVLEVYKPLNNSWTEKEDKDLKKVILKSISTEEVIINFQKKYNRSFNAVKLRISLLKKLDEKVSTHMKNFTNNMGKNRSFTKEEVKFIRDNMHLTSVELHKLFNEKFNIRSLYAIDAKRNLVKPKRKRRAKLKPNYRKKLFTNELDLELLSIYGDSFSLHNGAVKFKELHPSFSIEKIKNRYKQLISVKSKKLNSKVKYLVKNTKKKELIKILNQLPKVSKLILSKI